MVEDSFSVELSVEVIDIFGRSASASRFLRGSKFSMSMRRPDVWRGPPWDLRFPEKEMVAQEPEVDRAEGKHTGLKDKTDKELAAYRDVLVEEVAEIDAELDSRVSHQARV